MSARKKQKSQKKAPPKLKREGGARASRKAAPAPSAKRPTNKRVTKASAAAGSPKRRPADAAAKSRPSKKVPAKRPVAKSSVTEKPSGKDRERLRLIKEKAQAAKLKEQEKERLRLEKEREQAAKLKEQEKERLRKDKEKAHAAKLKEQEKERLRVEAEREQARRLKEQEKERVRLEKERERLQKEKEKERERQEKERELAREELRKAKEAERERLVQEREAERLRKLAEREAEREEARRAKEAERARLNAEREAYRKAKEIERERLRAEREAARRALEGKVARASKRAQRAEGLLGRGGSTRVYRPDAIPDQSGTRRRLGEGAPIPLIGIRPARAMMAAVEAPEPDSTPAPVSDSSPSPASTPLPSSTPPAQPSATSAPPADPARLTPPPPPVQSIEERWTLISERLQKTDPSFQRDYRESFDMSWIHHDSALEGVVYTFQELKTAVDPGVTVVPDSSLQPVCEEIRRNRQAIELVRELADKRRVPLNVDILKKIYVTLHPEEGDVKTVKYRKDIPQHRLYFHEYAPPDKIAYKVRQVMDWLNGPEPKKMKNALRVAARVHYDLLRVFPFQTDSGKVARLLMNIILMRAGHPPAIIHSTERQKYYEALKGQLPIIITMVNEAISNALLSIEKRLDEYESRGRVVPAASSASGNGGAAAS